MKNIFLSLLLISSISVLATNETAELFGVSSTTVSTYPNPANDKLVINVSTTLINGTISIKIYDVLGKIVLHKVGINTDGTGKSNNLIDVNEFFPGIYTIVITEPNGSSSSPVRFMVSR